MDYDMSIDGLNQPERQLLSGPVVHRCEAARPPLVDSYRLILGHFCRSLEAC